MRALLNDLYNTAFKYDETVFLALESTRENGNWTNFLADIFIDIAFLAAAATAVASGGAALVPAIAFLSAILHDWGLGKDKPDGINGLNGFFAQYQAGQLAMQQAIDEKLGYLTDETNNYANLQAAWQQDLVFNGTTYTLADLANEDFPDKENHSVEYHKLYDPMYDHHRRSVWNLAIMKCCTYYENWHDHIGTEKRVGALLDYAQQKFYPAPEHKGVYLRGWFENFDHDYNYYELVWWNLGIDGYAFPEAAINILFVDDTPGHIINPDGLFYRSYVFQQFSTTKPEFFLSWHELSGSPGSDFSTNDDWVFTGGLFPKLTH